MQLKEVPYKELRAGHDRELIREELGLWRGGEVPEEQARHFPNMVKALKEIAASKADKRGVSFEPKVAATRMVKYAHVIGHS